MADEDTAAQLLRTVRIFRVSTSTSLLFLMIMLGMIASRLNELRHTPVEVRVTPVGSYDYCVEFEHPLCPE